MHIHTQAAHTHTHTKFSWEFFKGLLSDQLGLWVFAAIMTALTGPADITSAGRPCQRLQGSEWQNVIRLYLCPCDNRPRLWPEQQSISSFMCRKVCCAQRRQLAAAAGDKDSWFMDATGKSQKEAATSVTERLLSGGDGNIDLLCDGRRSKVRGQSWPRLRQAAGPWPWLRH